MVRSEKSFVLPASIEMPPTRGRKWLTSALVAALLAYLLWAWFQPQTADDDDRSRYHNRSFRVVHVVDGDTFDIEVPDGDKTVTRIRLWGVDTPELGRGKKPTMHYGEEAKVFAVKTLANRTVHVVLSPDRTRGYYGRLLAYVYLERGGSMFNELLLEEGYAYADLRFPHHYSKQFVAIERRARRAGTGLWAEVTQETMPAWKQRFERSGD